MLCLPARAERNSKHAVRSVLDTARDIKPDGLDRQRNWAVRIEELKRLNESSGSRKISHDASDAPSTVGFDPAVKLTLPPTELTLVDCLAPLWPHAGSDLTCLIERMGWRLELAKGNAVTLMK